MDNYKLSQNTENPHPPNKHLIGERLADIALVETYGKKMTREIRGPLYKSHELKNGKFLVTFDHAGKGLASRDKQPLACFEIAGDDGKYVSAQADIQGTNTVTVWSEAIKDPKHLRFAWSATAIHNLMNSEELPAVSFRTDRNTKQ